MRLVAAKSHPAASRSVGIAPELQTALAFAVSAAFTGLAGVFLGAMTGFVSPDPFSLSFAVTVIAAAVLGGIGSVAGAVVGGAFLCLAPTLAQWIGVQPADPAGRHPDPGAALPPPGCGAGGRCRWLRCRLRPRLPAPSYGVAGSPRRLLRRGPSTARRPRGRRPHGAVRRSHRAARRLPRGTARRGPRDHRPERRGQDHAHQRALRPVLRRARHRRHPVRGPGPAAACARPPGAGSASHGRSSTPSCSPSSPSSRTCSARGVSRTARRAGPRRTSSAGSASRTSRDRYPHELPFGLQKRADIARAIAGGASVYRAGRAVRRPGRERAKHDRRADPRAERARSVDHHHRPRSGRPLRRRRAGGGLRLRHADRRRAPEGGAARRARPLLLPRRRPSRRRRRARRRRAAEVRRS